MRTVQSHCSKVTAAPGLWTTAAPGLRTTAAPGLRTTAAEQNADVIGNKMKLIQPDEAEEGTEKTM
ncbi:hypothetical protein INR49_017558 [Caranx melampygus]|nr:hypothetical protein INR49_017558 [Caranx melampygus]